MGAPRRVPDSTSISSTRPDPVSALIQRPCLTKPAQNSPPILSNVRLEASDGALGLTATDLDLSVVETTEAEVTQPGATTAPAHTLYDVVRKLPEGARVAIERSATGSEITLRSGRATFDLPCLPADEFPTMGDEGLEHRFALPAGELRKLIDRTRFAISTEETRYYLQGVLVSVGTLSTEYVATDGHILFAYHEDHDEEPDTKGVWIIPASVIKNIKLPKFNPIGLSVTRKRQVT